MIGLFAWLWQGTLVAVAALALLQLDRRVNATTRHLCLWLALAVVLTLPAGQAVRANAEAGSGAAPAATTPIESREQAVDAVAVFVTPALPAWVPAVVLTLWAVAAGLGVLRLGVALIGLRRLKRSTIPAPELAAQLTALRKRRPGGRQVALAVSDRCVAPCAAGLGRPTIVLPRALVGRLSRTQLEALVLHELAHLARYDDWTQLLQRVIEAVAGLHPGVWLLSRRIGLEREAACDDWVVRRTLPAHRYATCLADVASVARVRTSRLAGALTPSAIGARGGLRARVERLLSTDVDHGRRLKSPAVVLTAAALACGSALAFATTPTVVFAESDDGIEQVAAEAQLGADPAGEATSPAGLKVGLAPVLVRDAKSPVAASDAVARSYVAPTFGSATSAPPAGAAKPGQWNGRRAWTASGKDAAPALPAVAAAPHIVTTGALGGSRFAAPDLPPVAPPEQGDQSPSGWGRLTAAGSGIGTHAGRGGAAVARGMQHAGSSIGGMFTRAARSIADSF